MRILWITGSSGNFRISNLKRTGGWIIALKDALLTYQSTLELAIAFFSNTDDELTEIDGVTYLPIKYSIGNSRIEKIFWNIFRNENSYRNHRLQIMAERIHKFKPDLVHVWGIENFYSGILEYIQDLPSVVHIQGFSNACLFTPPCISVEDLKLCDCWIKRNILKKGVYNSYQNLKSRAENELRMSAFVKNWIGRTDWDRMMANILNSKAQYYYCNELLRSDFSNCKWSYHYDGVRFVIHSSISSDWYKGIDVILKTAKVLKKLRFGFRWNVYGCSDKEPIVRLISERLQISPENVNVKFYGKVEGKVIKESLLSCDCFVHPSYIENSSNAIAEAQMLGVPVIAQFVGGNPSMLINNSGILIPANDPFCLASELLRMTDKKHSTDISNNAIRIAHSRQNSQIVIEQLCIIYSDIINNKR